MIALLSDIHANLDALQAVLDDMKTFEITTAFCLGDTVGYGPKPAACQSLVDEHCMASLLGNHDAFLLVPENVLKDDFGPEVCAPIALARKQLSDEQIEAVHRMPISIDLDAFELVHASFEDPAGFNYIQCEKAAAANFAEQKRPVSFHGHTHIPVIWEERAPGKIRCFAPSDQALRLDPDCRYAVNVGSVGQPRDDDSRASYALYDHSTGTLLHRRVAYDIDKALKRFRTARLPKKNAERLTTGH